MATFRVGQMVRIVRGDLTGFTAEIAGELEPAFCDGGELHATDSCWCSNGSPLVHDLIVHASHICLGPDEDIAYPPEYLKPLHEPGDYQTLSELLRGVVPAGVKEEAT